MKLILKPNGSGWDYESAMLNPGASSDTPASYSDSGSGRCNA
jgi:hypothetical protein